MGMPEMYLQDRNLKNFEDVDSLLILASLLKQLIDGNRYSDINSIIIFTMEHEYYEAFSWTMAMLQEEMEKADGKLENFECIIGETIPNYNEFIRTLQVEWKAPRIGTEAVRDENGKVKVLFDIDTYKTGYKNIFFVYKESVEAKEDYNIQYKLSFIRNEM